MHSAGAGLRSGIIPTAVPGEKTMTIAALPLAAPFILLAAASLAASASEIRPRRYTLMSEVAGALTIGIALLSCLLLINLGSQTTGLTILANAGLSVRLDPLSVTMLLLVSFIGWVVLRYSRTYLDGEARQGAFTGWLLATLAAVLLAVIAGNLVQLTIGWVATSLCLHRLLLFYPDRPAARRAARKKFIMARLGDAALIIAFILLWAGAGTADIATILTQAAAPAAVPFMVAAAIFLALAALLKSAQFPTHGWLTEVMEAPTPVSALLHAGVINAGGFLLIRFADVMLQAPGVLAALVMLGGFTALFGSLVMLTQSAVKTSLAWSTVAQMGFMIMQCGLALFPLALLHVVAHSLYKAHAFLASGGAVERVAAARRPGPVAVPGTGAVLQAFAAAILIYALVGALFGFAGKSPQSIALGAILIFGVAYLLAQGLADAAPRELTQRTALSSLAAALGYFMLQNLTEWLMRGHLPAAPVPGPLEWTLVVLAVTSFAVVAVAQAMFPLWAYHPAAAGLRVHLANGLYVNAILDRLMRNWVNDASTSPQGRAT